MCGVKHGAHATHCAGPQGSEDSQQLSSLTEDSCREAASAKQAAAVRPMCVDTVILQQVVKGGMTGGVMDPRSKATRRTR